MTRLKDMFDPKLRPVALGCLTVIIIVVGALSSRTSAVDPRVTLQQERVSQDNRSAPAPTALRLAAAMDGEVSHTADRIAEVTTMAFSAGVYLAGAGIKGRLPRDVQTLMAGLAQNGLLPPGLGATESAGTFVSPWGSLSVRYRPAPLGVEIISIASKPEYGPALIVRTPDETSDKGEASLYVSDRLQGVIVPAPFAPAAEVVPLGWNPERLRSLK
jgi:hypothetical protein